MEMTLGARLRLARESKRLTIDEVARTLGRPLSWLSNLETGRTKNLPEPYQFRELAALVDVPVTVLLEAAGYLQPFDLTENRANPFERDDPRYAFVDALKGLDLSDPYDAYVAVTVATILRTMIAERERFRADAIAAMTALRSSPP